MQEYTPIASAMPNGGLRLRGDCRRKCTDGLCCNLGVQKTKPNLSTCIVNVAIA
ncbi:MULTISPECIES: hypothetical protein [unclassified Nostoc]|uniref:hypothetical protein n=1 Tax=unclassified Nostoc TaxID=2593658 RepID=UPI0015E3F4A5|nr:MULTISPECIES: hypothetical protein [unclassified Nostoc]